MAGFSISLTDDKSGEVLAALGEKAGAALEAVGLQAEGYVAMITPVDTGRLRSSITHQVEGDAVYIGTKVEYATYVETGTPKMKAQPYLEPGIMNHLDEYKAIIQAYLEQD